MRLFFAAWPDGPAASALSTLAIEVAERCGGRPVPEANIHLTLAFLGDVPEARMPELEAIAQAVRFPAFELALDRLGSFRRARVAWIGCGVVPPGLLSLESDLSARLRDAGFPLEDRPYAPHVTLARKAAHAVRHEGVAAIPWKAGSFELVQTEFGKGRYRRLAVFGAR